MNWKQSQQDNPKADNEFYLWLWNNHGSYALNADGELENNDTAQILNLRDLYDYFDGLGIIGTVGHGADYYFEVTYQDQAGANLFAGSPDYNTRIAVESALFTRMFQIRESQLLEGDANE